MLALLLLATLGITTPAHAVGTSVMTTADGSLQCRATGDIELSPDGKTYINGTDVHIGDNGTQDVIVLPSRVLFLKYAPAEPQSWAGTPPAFVWDAINRLAAALAASGSKP